MYMNASGLPGRCQVTNTGFCDRDSGKPISGQARDTAHNRTQEPHAAGPGTGPGLGLFDTQKLHGALGIVQALCHFVGVQVSLH